MELRSIKSAKIAYDPISGDLNHPADKRRFCYFAKTIHLEYEVYNPSHQYDLIILTESSDISYWRRLEKGPKLVYSLTDSYLAEKNNLKSNLRGIAKFTSSQHRYLELSFPGALKKMCRRADAVICSTSEQKTTIAKYCRNTHILFDAHFEVIKNKKEDYSFEKPFQLVWEGLPTNAYQLNQLTQILNKSDIRDEIVLNVVTDKYAYKYLNKYIRIDIEKYLSKFPIKCNFYEWSEKTLERVVLNSDLAIIPIDTKDPRMIGKPENKLLLFWRIGIPVLVANTPSYKEAMNRAGQKYVIKKDQDWLLYIKEFMTSELSRIHAGKKGYEYISKYYNDNEFNRRWEDVFRSIGYTL